MMPELSVITPMKHMGKYRDKVFRISFFLVYEFYTI